MTDEGFIKFQRARGMSWATIGGMLGVSGRAAEARYGDVSNGAVRREAWADFGPDADALVALLKAEPRPALALSVYLITLQRTLAGMAPLASQEALASEDPAWPRPIPAPQVTTCARRAPGMLDAIARGVAEATGLTIEALKGPDARKSVSIPRQQFMAEGMAAGYTATEVGAYLGRDPTTVLFGRSRHRARVEGRA